MAEGVFHSIVEENNNQKNFRIDSCGTGPWHVGQQPDSLAQETAKNHGIDISHLRGRQFSVEDFNRFDHILVMDASNLENVLAMSPSQEASDKVELLLDYHPDATERNVPDPYGEGEHQFERVFKLIQTACEHFYRSLK